MEHDVNELFQSFQAQVNEIASHASQVSKLKFSADLKNGTSFRFNYDADTYGKERKTYKPFSVFNAIVDIIGVFTTIALMVLHIHSFMWVLSCVMMIILLITNGVMHLFDEQRVRTIAVFCNLTDAMKSVFLCLCNFSLVQVNQTIMITTLTIGALSLLLLSIQTKGAQRASAIVLAFLPFMNLLGGIHSLFLPGADLLFALWALGPAYGKMSAKVTRNSIFALMGIMLASFQLSQLL